MLQLRQNGKRLAGLGVIYIPKLANSDDFVNTLHQPIRLAHAMYKTDKLTSRINSDYVKEAFRKRKNCLEETTCWLLKRGVMLSRFPSPEIDRHRQIPPMREPLTMVANRLVRLTTCRVQIVRCTQLHHCTCLAVP